MSLSCSDECTIQKSVMHGKSCCFHQFKVDVLVPVPVVVA